MGFNPFKAITRALGPAALPLSVVIRITAIGTAAASVAAGAVGTKIEGLVTKTGVAGPLVAGSSAAPGGGAGSENRYLTALGNDYFGSWGGGGVGHYEGSTAP